MDLCHVYMISSGVNTAVAFPNWRIKRMPRAEKCSLPAIRWPKAGMTTILFFALFWICYANGKSFNSAMFSYKHGETNKSACSSMTCKGGIQTAMDWLLSFNIRFNTKIIAPLPRPVTGWLFVFFSFRRCNWISVTWIYLGFPCASCILFWAQRSAGGCPLTQYCRKHYIQ